MHSFPRKAPLVIFKGMTKGRVARELRKADYIVDQVVYAMQNSAFMDKATSVYRKTLFDNTFLLKNANGFCFQQCKVLDKSCDIAHIWVIKASRYVSLKKCQLTKQKTLVESENCLKIGRLSEIHN